MTGSHHRLPHSGRVAALLHAMYLLAGYHMPWMFVSKFAAPSEVCREGMQLDHISKHLLAL